MDNRWNANTTFEILASQPGRILAIKLLIAKLAAREQISSGAQFLTHFPFNPKAQAIRKFFGDFNPYNMGHIALNP